MTTKEICEKAGVTVYPAEHDESAVVITLSSLETIIETAIKCTDAYKMAQKRVLETMHTEMLALAPNMKPVNLKYALDLVPFFAQAIMERGLQAEAENRRLKAVCQETHLWAISSLTESTETMAKGLPRIVEITGAQVEPIKTRK